MREPKRTSIVPLALAIALVIIAYNCGLLTMSDFAGR